MPLSEETIKYLHKLQRKLQKENKHENHIIRIKHAELTLQIRERRAKVQRWTTYRIMENKREYVLQILKKYGVENSRTM